MNGDKQLLTRISAILSVVGITTVYISSLLLTPAAVDIRAIDRGQTGKVVQVVAEVKRIDYASDTTFFTLSDNTGSIKAVKFSRENLSEGEEITAEGEIDIYRGELELIINKITRETT